MKQPPAFSMVLAPVGAYFSRNGRWLIPMLVAALVLAIGHLVIGFRASIPLLQGSWYFAYFSLGLSAFLTLTTPTRSARLARYTMSLAVIGAALWAYQSGA